jgi:hypothetical protein
VNWVTKVPFSDGTGHFKFDLYLLWHVLKSFLAEATATSTGKLLDIQPRNNAVAKLCSGKFNVAHC